MTAFYMFRLVYLTFWSPSRMSHEVEHHVHESPKTMTVPLMILAFFSATAGLLGVPAALGGSNRFEHFLAPVFSKAGAVAQAGGEAAVHHDPIEYALMVLSVGAAAAGWFFARRFYGNAGKDYQEPIAAAAPPVYNALYNKYWVDELYDMLFTGRRNLGPARLGAMGVGDALCTFDANVIDGGVNAAGWLTRLSARISIWWDTWIVDGLLVNGIAIVTRVLSYPVRLVQWGLVQWYALVMVAGLAGFVFYSMTR